MDLYSLVSILFFALVLGSVHALDPDHVLAVANLNHQRCGLRTRTRICLRWALGHSLALASIGFAVVLFGLAIPSLLAGLAEQAVGLVLVAIGILVLWQQSPAGQTLTRHQPDNKPRHPQAAWLIGLLHGTAGSASVLALLPMARFESPWLMMSYLGLFCLGVLLGMLMFAGVLNGVFGVVSRRGGQLVQRLRSFIALASIGLGIAMLVGAA